ncbi:hypothetical protein [Acidiplasma cupricumulans]|nr:hypothetical protein [Acidiplasma cupricumulans]
MHTIPLYGITFFGTNGIRGIPNDDLSAEFSMDVGKAMATFFSAKK